MVAQRFNNYAILANNLFKHAVIAINCTDILLLLHSLFNLGEMPERSNGAVSKTVVLLRVPRVRIPFSPQLMPVNQ